MQSSMMYLHVKKIGDKSVDPVKDLAGPYSSVPNRRAGPNKRAGGKILQKH